MNIKINTPLKLLSGKPIPTEDGDLTLGVAIANILSNTKKGGAMKLFILAQKFFSQDSVEIDEADLKLVESAVESSESYFTVVTGQILLVLSEAKEKAKEKIQEEKNDKKK